MFRIMAQQNSLSERVRRASSWRDHQRLQFEVIHNRDMTLFKSLLAVYRELVAKESTPLLRWAYANCTSEIFEHDIGPLSPYALRKGDFLSEEQALEQHKRLIKEVPNQVLGYLGLARAYKAGFWDPELKPYEKVLVDKYETVEINGQKLRVRRIHLTNPEEFRRYRLYRERILQIEPGNPFVYYWDALTFLYKAEFNKAFDTALKAYQLGMSQLLPVDCLALIVYSAWSAGRREEAEKYAKELRRWVAQAPKSAYVTVLPKRWQQCPLIDDLTR
jgi:hypothetical protein